MISNDFVSFRDSLVRLHIPGNRVGVYIRQHVFPTSLDQPGVIFVKFWYFHRMLVSFRHFDGFKAFSRILGEF